VADGDLAEKYYQEKMSELEDVDLNKDIENNQEI
jgi:hypothetical protein